MRKFKLTYQIITPTSASQGDFAYHGYVTRNGTTPRRNNFPKSPSEFPLRTALRMLWEHWDGACPMEPNREEHPQWIAASKQGGDDRVDMAIHLGGLTASSAKRVLKLLRS